MKIPSIGFLLLSFTAFAADTNGPPPLIPAYGELPPTFWEQHQSQIIMLGFAFLAAVFLLVKKWLRPEAKVVLPPGMAARQALAKFQSKPEDGKVLSEVSQILRRHIIATFELPAAELTTSEFCAAVSSNDEILSLIHI